MNKKNIRSFVKITILAFLIIVTINIGDNFINASTNTQKQEKTSNNNTTYKNQNTGGLGVTGVAISTNIGSSFSQINSLPATIYKEVFSVSDLINNSNSKYELIGNNMNIIKEYLNFLKTDVKSLINSSYDKSELLDTYIQQIEYRYKNGLENQKLLTEQKEVLTNTLNETNTKIEMLKTKIETDFKNSDSLSSLENIESYLKLKREYDNARMYIIYINHFIEQYNFLNNYAINLADILVNNKEAIIKNAYVVITDKTGIEDLKNFNLIFER